MNLKSQAPESPWDDTLLGASLLKPPSSQKLYRSTGAGAELSHTGV